MQITDGLLIGNDWKGLQALSPWGTPIHMHPCMCVYMYVRLSIEQVNWAKSDFVELLLCTAEFCGVLQCAFININTFSVHNNFHGSSRHIV